MKSRPHHVGIVGAGMLGMTLALRLRARGHRVTLLEGAPAAGGLASPWRHGDIRWDRYYHVILLSDSNLRGLLEEIGLGDRLRWGITRTGFYTDGRLHSMSNSLEFLRFPPLRLVDKLRLGATIAYAARVRDWEKLEQVPVSDWLRRLSGERTFERIWQPLLRAKLGDDHQHASAAFIWATIARMYAARRTGLKQEMFGYVEGGYETIIGRLVEVLAERDIELRCGAQVEHVEADAAGPTVHLDDAASQRFDSVVLTAPGATIGRLCPTLTDAEKARLGSVRYLGIVCASVLLDRPLAGFYVTNITDASPFTGIIEMSSLVDRAAFGGRSLLYLPRYLTQDDPLWQADDAAVRDLFVGALTRMYPRFAPRQIEAFQVARSRYVMALPTLGYSKSVVPPTGTSLPGVYVVNGAQIVNGTLNVNETVGLADRKVDELERLMRLRADGASVVA